MGALPLPVSALEPWTLPPPWMKTSTGSLLDDVADGGVHTFAVRQSSWPITSLVLLLSTCRQMAPKPEAASVVDQHACGCVSAQRSAPTGGAAYGMPRYAHAPLSIVPCTGPRSVSTTPGAGLTLVAQLPASPASVLVPPSPALAPPSLFDVNEELPPHATTASPKAKSTDVRTPHAGAARVPRPRCEQACAFPRASQDATRATGPPSSQSGVRLRSLEGVRNQPRSFGAETYSTLCACATASKVT
jgi:hypothetical protein